MNKFVIMGANGSGKGAQASRLAKAYDLFRKKELVVVVVDGTKPADGVEKDIRTQLHLGDPVRE